MKPEDTQLSPQQTHQQLFNNEDDRKLILGYLSGLLAAFVLGFRLILVNVSGESNVTEYLLVPMGVLFLVPALYYTLFWRAVSTLVAVGAGVNYGLELKTAIAFYGQPAPEGMSAVTIGDIVFPGISVILCVLFATFAIFGDIQEAKKSRNFRVLFNGVLTVTLAIVAWGMVNFLGSRKAKTFDWTQSKIFTLSEESKSIVQTVNKRLTMHLFLSRNSTSYSVVRRLADQYQEAMAGRLKLVVHDPLENRLAFYREAERLGLVGADYSDFQNVVFEVGEFTMEKNKDSGKLEKVWKTLRMEAINVREMFLYSARIRQRRKPIFKGEELCTNAILKVVGEQKPVICFLTGHREHNLRDNKSYGMTQFGRFLQSRYFDLRNVELGSNKNLPKDCQLLVIAGARTDLTEAELLRIKDFLLKGGRLLLLSDVLPAGEDALKPSSLTALMRDYNIEITRHLIVGRAYVEREGKRMRVPIVENVDFGSFDAEHKIVKPLAGMRVVASESRALTTPPINKLATATPLILGGIKADTIAVLRPRDFQRRGYSFRKDQDMGEGFSLAVASVREPKPGSDEKSSRVVVIGDSDIIDNRSVHKGKNREFLLNCVNWLLEKDGRFVREAKKPPTWSLDISEQSKILLQVSALFLLPAFPLSMGLLMFLLRRR